VTSATVTSEPAGLVVEEGTLLAKKYRLVRPAGFGGMAQLWVAKNESTDAEVCIKLLVPEQRDSEAVARFRREANAAARLTHRAIVQVFDLLELTTSGDTARDGAPIAALAIVMELLHGETLGDRLMKAGKLPVDEALDVALPFLSALAHAHRADVIHRDIKPDNVFLARDPDGKVLPKVLDFGVSKIRSADVPVLTVDGVMLGTPSFMSPEQARGARDVDARSDVFSAGILLYLMLSGHNPFEGERFHSIVEAILEREPPPLADVPEPVAQVIMRALAKDPARRFADATELGIALRRASGRASTTDSGQMPASARASTTGIRARSLSETSVPPVGSASVVPDEGVADAAAPPSGDRAAAARKRAMKIVVGVVGVSAAILVAALVRSAVSARATSDGDGARAGGEAAPSGERAPAAALGETPAPPAPTSTAAPPSASGSAAPSATPATSNAAAGSSPPPTTPSTARSTTTSTATPTARSTSTATSTATPTPTPTARSTTTPTATPTATPTPTSRPRPPRPTPPSTASPTTPDRPREPSIVRDPGF
jgi:serine/threonine-protein kinase